MNMPEIDFIGKPDEYKKDKSEFIPDPFENGEVVLMRISKQSYDGERDIYKMRFDELLADTPRKYFLNFWMVSKGGERNTYKVHMLHNLNEVIFGVRAWPDTTDQALVGMIVKCKFGIDKKNPKFGPQIVEFIRADAKFKNLSKPEIDGAKQLFSGNIDDGEDAWEE